MRGQGQHGEGVEGCPVQQRVPEALAGQQHDEVHHELGVEHQQPGHGGAHHPAAVVDEPQSAVPGRRAHVAAPHHDSSCQAAALHIWASGQQRVVLLHVPQSVVRRLHPVLETE